MSENGDRRPAVTMPDPDLPVGCVVGSLGARDGSRRMVLIFSMPGLTAAVPLRGEQWDALVRLGAAVRPTLDIVIPPPAGVPLERTEEGGFRVDGS